MGIIVSTPNRSLASEHFELPTKERDHIVVLEVVMNQFLFILQKLRFIHYLSKKNFD